MNKQTTAHMLVYAGEHIEVHGKATGYHHHTRGAADPVGALRRVGAGDQALSLATGILLDAVRKRTKYTTIERWSDNSTDTEVARFLFELSREVEAEHNA